MTLAVALVLLAAIPSAQSQDSFWKGSMCNDSSFLLQPFNNTAPAIAFNTFPDLLQYMKTTPPHTPLSLRLALGPGHQLGFSTWDILIRSTTSDFPVVVQHFCKCELCELASGLELVPGYVHSILDLGGNIGAAAMVMASVFPRASIVTVEPGTSTFHVLNANVGRNARITSVLGAAWPKTTLLTFQGSVYGAGPQEIHDWATSVGPIRSEISRAEDLVPAYSIDYLIGKYFPGRLVDILKMDIEGGEVALFHAAAVHAPIWLHAVRCLVIEWHGHAKTKEHYAKFHGWLGVYGFKRLPDFGEHEAWCRRSQAAKHGSPAAIHEP